MRIEELKPSQRVKGRWLAVMDDGSILRLGESQVIDFSLYAGKELSPDEAQRLSDCARTDALKSKAITLLTAKPLSRKELERKLLTWEASEEEASALCNRMEELGLLNDELYARQVVSHYSSRGYGVRKLRDELFRRGVPRQFWDEALSAAEDPDAAIDAFLCKKLAGQQPNPQLLKKLTDTLARRGFRWEDIHSAVNRLGICTDD